MAVGRGTLVQEISALERTLWCIIHYVYVYAQAKHTSLAYPECMYMHRSYIQLAYPE